MYCCIVSQKGSLAAKEAAHRGGRETDCWSSLTHVKTELKRATLDELSTWHLLKAKEREDSRRGFYISRAKFGIDPILGKAPKKYAARYYQLKVGHGAVGTFLAKIGAIESPKCWWCEQTVVHLYAKCRRWRRERRRLIRELGKQGITWEAQVDKRWLASLLANERAIGALLKFLEDTEVGSREGATEREAEWERRNDREGESRLSN